MIASEKDINGAAAKALREEAGLTQKAFWNSMGLTQSGGSKYEQNNRIPRPIRILIYTMYVAGIKVDATSKSGTEQLVRLAQLQASETSQKSSEVGAKIMQAMSHARKAANILSAL